MTVKKIVTGNLSSKNASEDLSTADAFSLLSKHCVQQFPVVNCLGDARRQVNFLQSLHF
jgi:hypothetical protein